LLLFRFAPERARPAEDLFVWADRDGLGPRDGDELFLAAYRHAVRLAPAVLAFGVQAPALDVVRQRDGKDLLLEARHDRLGADGERHLHAPREVARHPVAAGNVDLRLAAVLETEDAPVLEEAVDGREDLDGLAH